MDGVPLAVMLHQLGLEFSDVENYSVRIIERSRPLDGNKKKSFLSTKID